MSEHNQQCFISEAQRAEFHAALDKILATPNTRGVLVLISALQEDDILITGILHGSLRPLDVIEFCAKGGASILEQMKEQGDTPSGRRQ